jgi:Zn-finger nucleic acid-binding protein
MNAKYEPLQLRNMELKYCERCGNIWLRRSGTGRTLCAPCTKAEASLLMDGPVSFLQVWTRLRAAVQA